ncbi:MAG: glycerophosphodiester phosphodiesterase [Alphaproteobacteria bacterium]|nr:glycerophosphodiester phosphodiesterase [Alphaproteobacteria bacterium]
MTDSLFPRVIAHRGIVSGNYAGNSHRAIEEALNSPVEGIEVDVRLSKDGIPFIFHDGLLENSTNGTGRPEDKTWHQLKEIEYTQNPDHHSTLILLEDVLKMVGSHKFLFLHAKDRGGFGRPLAHGIVRLIEKYHLQKSIIIESFNPFFLRVVRLKSKDITILYDFKIDTKSAQEEAHPDRIPWAFKQPFIQKQIVRLLRPDLLGPHWGIGHDLLAHFVRHNYPMMCWTVDDSVVAERLFSAGIMGVKSDCPLKIMEIFITRHAPY